MLTKTQKQILNTAIKLSNNGHAILNEYDISYHLKIHPNIVFKAVKVLAEKKTYWNMCMLVVLRLHRDLYSLRIL